MRFLVNPPPHTHNVLPIFFKQATLIPLSGPSQLLTPRPDTPDSTLKHGQ